MRRKLVRACWGIILPWLAYSVLEPLSKRVHPPESLSAVLPALVEILHFWPYIGIGVLLAGEAWEDIAKESKETIGHLLIETRRSIGLTIRETRAALEHQVDEARLQLSTVITKSLHDGMVELSHVMAQAIKEKPFVLSTEHSEPTPPTLAAPANDAILQRAKALFENGKLDEAITLLRSTGREDDSKHETELLKLLVYSDKPEHWRDTGPLLKKYGTAEQFNIIAYRYWLAGDTTNALEHAKDALTRAIAEKSQLMIVRSKNNVAYYLADANVGIEEELARQLAAEAVKEVGELRQKKVKGVDAVAEAKTMATRGYVTITFAKSVQEVREGVRLCEQAWERGASVELLEKHINRARARLSELRGEESPTNQLDPETSR